MEKTYEHALDDLAAAIPAAGCRVALVPTLEIDRAAALASDLAQLIGRDRSGHTLLLSLEAADGALDHEIGVEDTEGLMEVLAGATTLAGVAAHGRARGFVYVPAGRNALDPVAILSSAAFDTLTRSAAEKGGVVLAFIPQSVLVSATPPLLDGVVWLGPAPGDDRIPTGWTTLGSLEPPGASGPDPEDAAAAHEAGPSDAESDPESDADTDAKPGAEPIATGRIPKWVLVAGAILVILASVAFGATVFLRGNDANSFLPQNDSLWLAPPPNPEEGP